MAVIQCVRRFVPTVQDSNINPGPGQPGPQSKPNMSINYYNEQTRRNARVNEIRLNGRPAYIVNYQDKNGVCHSKIRETMEAANRDMEEHGYHKKGIIDESGCARYTMTLEQLQNLYRKLENFVADCTQQEYIEYGAEITSVYELIHKHINAETYK